MDYPKYFNPKNSLKLFGLEENFNFLLSIYSKDKLPKVLMPSGLKTKFNFLSEWVPYPNEFKFCSARMLSKKTPLPLCLSTFCSE